VRSLDKESLENPLWHTDIVFPDLPSAIPDIQRRIALGADRILVEVVHGKEEG
jgi:hypothetical protein